MIFLLFILLLTGTAEAGEIVTPKGLPCQSEPGMELDQVICKEGQVFLYNEKTQDFDIPWYPRSKRCLATMEQAMRAMDEFRFHYDTGFRISNENAVLKICDEECQAEKLLAQTKRLREAETLWTEAKRCWREK